MCVDIDEAWAHDPTDGIDRLTGDSVGVDDADGGDPATGDTDVARPGWAPRTVDQSGIADDQIEHVEPRMSEHNRRATVSLQ
jgi:hypothetical protein